VDARATMRQWNSNNGSLEHIEDLQGTDFRPQGAGAHSGNGSGREVVMVRIECRGNQHG
jgi:hypothetical protein